MEDGNCKRMREVDEGKVLAEGVPGSNGMVCFVCGAVVAEAHRLTFMLTSACNCCCVVGFDCMRTPFWFRVDLSLFPANVSLNDVVPCLFCGFGGLSWRDRFRFAKGVPLCIFCLHKKAAEIGELDGPDVTPFLRLGMFIRSCERMFGIYEDEAIFPGREGGELGFRKIEHANAFVLSRRPRPAVAAKPLGEIGQAKA